MSEIDRSLLDVNPRVRARPLEFDQFADRRPFDGFEAQLVAARWAGGRDDLRPARWSTSSSPRRLSPSPGAPDADAVRHGLDRRRRLPRANASAFRAVRSRSRGRSRRPNASCAACGCARSRSSLIVAAIAAAVGVWIANSVTAPLRRLDRRPPSTSSTTGRLDGSVGSAGDDEVGRLSAAFDRMLATLARSQAGTAAARAGRRPRAADAVDEPAHQPRRAAPPPGPVAHRPRGGASPTCTPRRRS